MKTRVLVLLICLGLAVSCKDTVTGPSLGTNLLENPTFVWNGEPSLHGWISESTAGVEFSSDVPTEGSGQSIIVHPSWLPTWPIGIIYQVIPASVGTHTYRIAVFGKKTEIPGGVGVRLNRAGTPSASDWRLRIAVEDTTWTLYSQTDTISAGAGDSLFFGVLTGACELCLGSTYLNTCKFEKLD